MLPHCQFCSNSLLVHTASIYQNSVHIIFPTGTGLVVTSSYTVYFCSKQIMTGIKDIYQGLFYIFFSMPFHQFNTSVVLHSRPGAGGGTPVRTGCSGNRPPNRLISSEVLLPLLRSNYGAHLDSLTTKRRELARLDLWQVVIRWRLFFFSSPGNIHLGEERVSVGGSAQPGSCEGWRTIIIVMKFKKKKNDTDWRCASLCLLFSLCFFFKGSFTATYFEPELKPGFIF